MDALEALGHDRLDAGEAHALGRPVARAALAVVGAGDDDQRLAALHVGLDRLPHAHRLAFRLDAGQRALAHLAFGIAGHLVLQRRVGEGGALRRQVVAAVRGVGIEVLFRQAHLREVFAGRAVEQDRVRRRQVVGRDVVAEDRQRAQAGERARLGQRALPIRRAADVGAHLAPVVQRLHRFAVLDHRAEHRVVHLAVVLRLHRSFHDGVDLGVRRPQVLQQDRRAIGAMAQRVLLDIEAHGAGDRVGHHQRRRGKEGLLRVGMDAAVEVAVARKHRRRVQVALDDLLLDGRIERAAHAVAGGAGEGDDAEAQRLELGLQASLFEIELHGLRAGRQRGLHPGLAHQAQRVRLLRQQAGGDDVARVRGVRARRDRGDDHRAIRHQALRFLLACGGEVAGNALGSQLTRRDARMRVRGAGHRAHHGREVEVQRALVLGGLQIIGPQAERLRIGLDQRHLLVRAAGQAQVVERVAVDEEHRRGRAVLRRHVRDRRAVAEGQRRRTFAAELKVGPDHLRLAQELRQREHDVGGGDARLRLARQLDGDDVRQAHP